MFGTNSTKKPPTIVPGIDATPPTTRPTNSATASDEGEAVGRDERDRDRAERARRRRCRAR